MPLVFTVNLRPYQLKAVEEIRAAYRVGKRAPLLVSPTGSGKTCVFSFIAQGASAKGNRTLILTHRQEIMRQIGDALDDFKCPYSQIWSGALFVAEAPTHIASVQTLVRRLAYLNRPSDPDLIVIDEAHHSVCESYKRIIAAYPNAKILGVTATPQRLDGSGLGEIFDSMILGPSVQELIDHNFLSKPVYYAPPSSVDVGRLKILAGDYRRDQAEAMMDKPSITGSAVEHWKLHANGLPAIAFCTSLKHAANVSAEFRNAGFTSEVIDGTLDIDERKRRTDEFRRGNMHVLVSCEIINEGFDVAGAHCGIMLRPTASLALHLQQIGRILRPCLGKSRALILDHVGNCLRHGLAEEPRDWSLDAKRRRRSSLVTIHNRQCPQCYAVFAPNPKCPQCGYEFPVKPRAVNHIKGTLSELTAEQISEQKKRARMEVGMARDFASLLAIEKHRGYKKGWAYFQWRIKRKRGPVAAVPSRPAQWLPKSELSP